MASIVSRATFRLKSQVRTFAARRYKNESPLLWQDGALAAPKFENVGLLKNAEPQLLELAKKVKLELDPTSQVRQERSTTYSALISMLREEADEADELPVSEAEMELLTKTQRLLQSVKLPKNIKDGFRAQIAGELFAIGQLTNSHAAIKQEYAAVITGLRSSPKEAAYLRSQVDPELRVKLAVNLLTEVGVSPLLVEKVCATLYNGYLRDVEQVYDNYLELLSVGNNEIKGTVFTSDALDAQEQEHVRAALQKSSAVQAGQKLVLDFKTDATLLGGLSVQIGTSFADLSLRKRLNALVRRQATEGGDVQPLEQDWASAELAKAESSESGKKTLVDVPAAWVWAKEDVQSELESELAALQAEPAKAL